MVSSGRKLNMSFVFISKSFLKVPKTIRLNVTHYSILKIPKKRKIQHIPYNHWSDIDSKDLIKLYKDYTKDPILFLVNDTIPSSDDHSLRFRKNLL